MPRISAAQLPAYVGHIVEVEGPLQVGEYWPRLGPCELIPPEITTTHRALAAYSRSIPEPPELAPWRQRITAHGGSLQVRARGTVLHGGTKLSAYRVQVEAV